MILLDTVNRKLQVIFAGAGATNNCPVSVSYVELSTASISPATALAMTNGSTAVDLVAAPASGYQREIRLITLYNADTATVTPTIRINDNGTPYSLWKGTLAIGDTLTYAHGQGWKVTDTNGNIKQLTGSVSLTTGVSGILPVANGGTGIAYFNPTGPTTSRAYAFPDAACTILTTNALVTSAQGGTANGFTKFTGPASSEKTFTLPNATDSIACLGQANAFTKQQYFSQASLSISAGSCAWDLSIGQTALLTANATFTLSNPTNQVAGSTYMLCIKQDGTGSRVITWSSSYKFPGGTKPVLSTAASSVDLFSFYSDGTNMYGVGQKAFS